MPVIVPIALAVALKSWIPLVVCWGLIGIGLGVWGATRLTRAEPMPPNQTRDGVQIEPGMIVTHEQLGKGCVVGREPPLTNHIWRIFFASPQRVIHCTASELSAGDDDGSVH